MKEHSLTENTEAEVIERLAKGALLRDLLTAVKGIPSHAQLFRSVPLRGLPDEPKGDIDLLCVPPLHPELAVAVQVKKIKVDAEAIQTGRPNGLQGLKTGIRQANLLSKIGFHQVYLFVFVMVDSREQNAGRISFASLPPELRRLIERCIADIRCAGLVQSVGLAHYEFAQTMDTPDPFDSNHLQLVDLAAQLSQRAEVTNWVKAACERGM